MSTITVKTRFAPSPTGHIHLGNLRTALFSALVARHDPHGCFLLRIEDTDRERSREDYTHALLSDLRWLGLNWDEGPEVGGPHAPYAQSERDALYEQYFQRLQAQDQLYPCYCTPRELELSRKAQLSAGRPPRYSGRCAHLSEDERQRLHAEGRQPTLRFRVPAGRAIEFDDLVRGPQRVMSDDIGDFIVRKADGAAQFFFVNALDDALMGVTHVLRGDDHLTNTPRQLLLLEAFGLPAPRYGHIALIVGADGGPLSKRNGSLSVQQLRALGYQPGALLNYLARLGHSYEQEQGYLSLTGLASGFNTQRLGRAAARYDQAQLDHWQAEAVARLDDAQFWNWVGAEVADLVPTEQRSAFVVAVKPNVRFPSDALYWAQQLFAQSTLEWSAEQTALLKQAGEDFFAAALAAYQAGADYKSLTEAIKQSTGAKGKALFLPLRIVLSGSDHGPELARLLALLPAEFVQTRLQAAQAL